VRPQVETYCLEPFELIYQLILSFGNLPVVGNDMRAFWNRSELDTDFAGIRRRSCLDPVR